MFEDFWTTRYSGQDISDFLLGATPLFCPKYPFWPTPYLEQLRNDILDKDVSLGSRTGDVDNRGHRFVEGPLVKLCTDFDELTWENPVSWSKRCHFRTWTDRAVLTGRRQAGRGSQPVLLATWTLRAWTTSQGAPCTLHAAGWPSCYSGLSAAVPECADSADRCRMTNY